MMNLFINIRFFDILDILLVAYFLYFMYNLIKGTVAINIFIGIIAVYFFWRLIQVFEMEMLGEILGQFFSVGVIALIIVFQQEIRQFLFLLGKSQVFEKGFKFRNILLGKLQVNNDLNLDVSKIIEAINTMSLSKTGALIILTRKNELMAYINTGEFINAKLSGLLIENIFYKNSPLHDGAIIISNNRIKAARCVLPLIEDDDFPEDLGLRHRAGAGVTNNTDAVAIIVSEQTGQISMAESGRIYRRLTPDDVRIKLNEMFLIKEKQ